MLGKTRQTSRTPYLATLLTVLTGSLFLLTMIPQNVSASVLSDTVAQMQPGEWRTLTPANVSAINNASNWAVYADSATWDPISHKLLFLGSYHGTGYKFPIYSESTNSWSAGPALPNIPFSQIFVGHGYDFNTIDTNGNFYYRISDDLYNYVRSQIPSAQQMFKYNIAANTWTAIPPNSLKNATTCCEGIAYFPERGGIVYPDSSGKIWFFSDSNQQWSLISTIAGWGSTWNFTEYNPVHKIVLFGSSTGKLFKMDSAGTVTPLNNIPITIYDGSGFTGHVTVDPASGDFLVLTASGTSPNTFTLYAYNILSDTWRLAANQPPSSMIGAVVSAPVSTYSVNMFASCGMYAADCDGKIYLYKHSSSSATPPITPAPTVSLVASPTSVSSGSAATLTWSSINATSCSASGGWSGTKAINGSEGTSTLTQNSTYTLSCTGTGGSASQSITVAVSSSTTPTSTSSADGDYQARCAAPGVVKCQGFNTMGVYGNADLIKLSTDSVHGNIYPRGDGQYRADVDTTIKRSGSGSLRFKMDGGYANANIAGQYICCGNTGVPPTVKEGLGAAFGENTDWYVQFAVRFSPEYFSNQNNGWNANPKIAIFHYNNQSCASKELTTNTYYNTRWLHGYKDCGSNGLWTNLDGFTFRPTSSGTPLLLEQGEYYCDYGGFSNCFTLPSDKWITLYYKIHNGTWGSANSTIEGWYAVDGLSYKKWLNITANFTIDCNGASPCSAESFNNVTFTPYMTALTKAAPVDAYVWYDELIVSTQPIPAPGSVQATTPPAAPSALVLH